MNTQINMIEGSLRQWDALQTSIILNDKALTEHEQEQLRLCRKAYNNLVQYAELLSFNCNKLSSIIIRKGE